MTNRKDIILNEVSSGAGKFGDRFVTIVGVSWLTDYRVF